MTTYDNNNINKCSYIPDIVDDVIKTDKKVNSDFFIKELEILSKKRGDTIEADKDTILSLFLIYAVVKSRSFFKEVLKAKEESITAIQAALEGQSKGEEYKDVCKRLAAKTNALDNAVEKIQKLESKLAKCKDKMGNDYDSGESETENEEDTNVFSKQMQMVNNLQQFSLSFKEYPPLNQSIGTSDIANDEQIGAVKEILGIRDIKEFTKASFEFTISCGSRSTSDKDPYDGIIKIGGKTWRRKDFAQAIKASGITVRQFCAAYANMYWNFNLARGTPPENWRKAGFTEKTKFAAFDFFYAVGSNAAIPTEPDGSVKLIRPPTNEENEANTAMRWANIYVQNSSNAGHVTSSPLYNKGNSYEVKNKLSITEL